MNSSARRRVALYKADGSYPAGVTGSKGSWLSFCSSISERRWRLFFRSRGPNLCIQRAELDKLGPLRWYVLKNLEEWARRLSRVRSEIICTCGPVDATTFIRTAAPHVRDNIGGGQRA